MRYTKNQILLFTTNLLIIFTLFSVGNSKISGQFSLGVLFTVLLWHRTGQHTSRWLAVGVLWGGLFLAILWPRFIPG